MKRLSLITFALITLSCTHESIAPEEHSYVYIRFGNTVSRAGMFTEEDESYISDLQVFVFNADGSIESVESLNLANPKMKVSCGNGKIFWAIANYAAPANVRDETELINTVIPLRENEAGKLIMCGRAVADIHKDRDIRIKLERLVAKVSIKNVSRQFSSSQLGDKTLEIRSIYLINVVGESKIAGKMTDPVWKNKRQFESGDADMILCASDLELYLDNCSSRSVSRSFYCYPNNIPEDKCEESWSPRRTRLVVEAELDGKVCYYSLTIPYISKNHSYSVDNLVLRGKGSPKPDSPYGSCDCSAVITVSDWTNGATYTEEL